MGQALPYVTAMIVARNEEEYIKQSVLSFLNQDYPKECMELLLIDGESEDHTVERARETVEEYCRQGERVSVRYLQNPGRLLATGWNLGIREARGEFVVRIDAHAQAAQDLISKCIKILQEHPEVACAGGRIVTEPLTEKGRVIANVLSSPFGVGNARFRYTEESGYVDTVAYGVYRKEIFEKAGYFNEKFQRNQDNDMHGRIKNCGGKFYLEASVKSLYHSRETVKGMMKQAYGNGRWIVIGLKESESREGISLRHLVPLLFVVANILLMVMGIFFKTFRWMFFGMYLLYFSLAVFFALKKTQSVSEVLRICMYDWLLHMSYGLGALCAWM